MKKFICNVTKNGMIVTGYEQELTGTLEEVKADYEYWLSNEFDELPEYECEEGLKMNYLTNERSNRMCNDIVAHITNPASMYYLNYIGDMGVFDLSPDVFGDKLTFEAILLAWNAGLELENSGFGVNYGRLETMLRFRIVSEYDIMAAVVAAINKRTPSNLRLSIDGRWDK